MPAAPKANPPHSHLTRPGPSPVSPRVLAALALPVSAISIRSFWRSWIRVWPCCARCFRPTTVWRCRCPAPAARAWRPAVVNLIEPGDAVLIGVNGVFGTRMVDVAQRCGAKVDTVEAEWGAALDAATGRRCAGEEQIQAGRHCARRDVHGCVAAAGRYRQARARQRRAVAGRRRDVARRRAGAGRRTWASTPATAARRNVWAVRRGFRR